jgi:hypothetical protein
MVNGFLAGEAVSGRWQYATNSQQGLSRGNPVGHPFVLAEGVLVNKLPERTLCESEVEVEGEPGNIT